MVVSDVIKILSTFPMDTPVKVVTPDQPLQEDGSDDFGGMALRDLIIDVSPYDIVVLDYI